MKNMMPVALMLWVLTVACDAPVAPAAGPPEAPQQEIVREYGEDETQADQAMEELTSLHNTIRESLEQWRETPSSVGPAFEGEEDSLATEILERCDRLEREANMLLEQEYIREHQGAEMDLADMINFARATRDEVSGAK